MNQKNHREHQCLKCIYLKGEGTEKQREIFHLLVYFSDTISNWGQSKSGQSQESGIIPSEAHTPHLDHHQLPSRSISGCCIRSIDQSRLEPATPVRNKGIPSGGLTCCVMMPDPKGYDFLRIQRVQEICNVDQKHQLEACWDQPQQLEGMQNNMPSRYTVVTVLPDTHQTSPLATCGFSA